MTSGRLKCAGPSGLFLISDQDPGPSTPAKDVSDLSGLNRSIVSNHRF